MSALRDLWQGLPAAAQDVAVLLALLAPALAVGLWLLGGHRPWPLARALLWRYRGTNALFVTLIAIAVALGTGLTAQERALREGTAAAARPFPLIVSAPGSPVDMMLAAVYLRPTDAALLDGRTFAAIAGHERVRLAAPIAYGDSVGGAPVIGTVPAFVDHLAPLAQGRAFRATREAVAGALAPVAVGDAFEPAHGVGHAAESGAHEGTRITVVGRLAPTGSPWDRAVLVPVETVWETHGLSNGHAPGGHAPGGRAGGDAIGPPFAPDLFPGTPAILVVGHRPADAYALRAAFTRTGNTMAFFPGAVLAALHNLMGDVREAMSLLATVSQALVAAAVLAGLFALVRLFAPRLALLRAIGAPGRFAVAIVWLYAGTLVCLGAAAGLLLGFAVAAVLSRVVTARTDIALAATLGWSEWHAVAAFVSLAVLLALVPATLAARRPILGDLR